MYLDLDRGREFYKKMLLIRRFEERCVELYSHQKIRGFLHLYIGEEAIAVGIMQALNGEDAVLATYREHGHALARGIAAKNVMAELYGKVEGASRGRGGSMHIFDAKTRFYGGSAIVGGNLPLAVGIALSDKMMQRKRVTVCFFGDGAMAEGEFHEALNLAALWQLPVLFVCENNLYGMGTAIKLSHSETNLARKAAAYRVDSQQVDGMDVLKVAQAAEEAVQKIRAEEGPVFLECLSYRFRAHSMYDAELYREKSEVEEWKKKDPLKLLQKRLETMGLWEETNAQGLEDEISDMINEAVDFAENGKLEPVEDLMNFVYSPKEKQ